MLRKDCTQGMTIDEIERINKEQLIEDEYFYVHVASRYADHAIYASESATSVYDTFSSEWFSLYRAAYEWALSARGTSNDYELMTEEEEMQASFYLNAVLDEQSDNLIIGNNKHPYSDLVWAFSYRDDMTRKYFKNPKNRGTSCFTGRAYGYIV